MKITCYFLTFVWLLFIPEIALTQKLYKEIDPYAKIIDYEFKVPEEIYKDARQRTGYAKRRYDDYIYTYLHKGDFISIGDHDRVSVAIYNRDFSWMQTNLYYDSSDKDYKKTVQIIQDELNRAGYTMMEEPDFYFKVINQAGEWYKMEILLKTKDRDNEDYHTVIFSKDFKFIKKQS